MIRIAAAGDVHYGLDSAGLMAPHLEGLEESADVLLLAGDLTQHGGVDEAAVLAADLAPVEVPMVAVLGNHDHNSDQEAGIRARLEDVGVVVLEGESHTIAHGGGTLGVAGVKGFCGGFVGASATDFGEPEMKSFVRHTREAAESLETALGSLEADVRVALMHYAPTEQTLQGERLEIYPFLGSYLLGEAVDRVGASLIVHGHAHRGSEKGVTPGGTPVRNVALPVIHRPYNVYRLQDGHALA